MLATQQKTSVLYFTVVKNLHNSIGLIIYDYWNMRSFLFLSNLTYFHSQNLKLYNLNDITKATHRTLEPELEAVKKVATIFPWRVITCVARWFLLRWHSVEFNRNFLSGNVWLSLGLVFFQNYKAKITRQCLALEFCIGSKLKAPS